MSLRVAVRLLLLCCLSAVSVSKPAYDREHPPKAGDEGVFYGPLVKVVDGDSLNAKVQGVVMRFRLQGVDAPEHDQPYGKESTALLRQLTRGPGQQLVLVFDDVDKYGRVIVQAWVGDLELNAEMVSRGAAWFDSAYTRDDRLYRIEQEARDRKVGLWALPAKNRIEPWEWRKRKRRPAKPAATSPAIDAPLSTSASNQVISHMRGRFPQKPIRHVVLTHHHGGHIGRTAQLHR
jgi:micrococcal nuclease